ncbi:MAG: hypothetical protein IT363_02440 [Methanoregulaceae archaeon]|nr:hypothetical protein [Methanoregulaceae archaeon]
MLLVGALIGLGLALAMLAIRARCWAAVRPIGVISLVLLGLLSVAAVLFLFSVGAKGSEGGIAALTALVILVLGLTLVLGLMVLVGANQAAAFKLPMWTTCLSVIPEIVVLGLLLLAYQSQVAAPASRAVTAEWWERELAHRNSRKAKREEIPEQYRGITTQMLNEHVKTQSDMAKHGLSVPPLVPREVENAIRNAELQTMDIGPIPDRARQLQIGVDENSFRKGAVGAWLLGALACPWIIRKRVLPPWHLPTA